jgi:hypothetical protein
MLYVQKMFKPCLTVLLNKLYQNFRNTFCYYELFPLRSDMNTHQQQVSYKWRYWCRNTHRKKDIPLCICCKIPMWVSYCCFVLNVLVEWLELLLRIRHPGFESLPGDWLSSLKFFVVFLRISSCILGHSHSVSSFTSCQSTLHNL